MFLKEAETIELFSQIYMVIFKKNSNWKQFQVSLGVFDSEVWIQRNSSLWAKCTQL